MDLELENEALRKGRTELKNQMKRNERLVYGKAAGGGTRNASASIGNGTAAVGKKK